MRLGDQPALERARQLSGAGLAFRTGPFNVRVRSPIAEVHRGIGNLYDAHPLVGDDEFCDFTLELVPSGGLRRWIKPQVRLNFDAQTPFEPMPRDHAFALFEWSLNWCITSASHQFLILHAAVIEREGCAAILPAPPGSGKSTLCAGLIQRGWRLLSDELALICTSTGALHPLARPVSLKNESIRVIGGFEPGAVFGEPTHDTAKGTVTHLKPRPTDVMRMDEVARPRWVIFPRYVRDAAPELTPRPKADSMIELGRNAFNYALLGRTGFETLADVITATDCYDFRYSRLDDAVQVFDQLVRQRQST